MIGRSRVGGIGFEECASGEHVDDVFDGGYVLSYGCGWECDFAAEEEGVGGCEEGTWSVFVLEEDVCCFVLGMQWWWRWYVWRMFGMW